MMNTNELIAHLADFSQSLEATNNPKTHELIGFMVYMLHDLATAVHGEDPIASNITPLAPGGVA
jgi:hypothetical protein